MQTETTIQTSDEVPLEPRVFLHGLKYLNTALHPGLLAAPQEKLA